MDISASTGFRRLLSPAYAAADSVPAGWMLALPELTRLIAVRFQADRGYLLANLINVPRQKFGDLFDRCSERKPALNVDEFSFRPGFTGSYTWGDCHDD
jgi:hypothetical protein